MLYVVSCMSYVVCRKGNVAHVIVIVIRALLRALLGADVLCRVGMMPRATLASA